MDKISEENMQDKAIYILKKLNLLVGKGLKIILER